MFLHHPSTVFAATTSLVLAACQSAPKVAPTASHAARTTPAGITAPQTCFILRQVDGPLQIRKGGDTCSQRFTPASTFKVPHTLIALETGARRGPEELDRWDGTRAANDACEADQTLRSALQNSCVWYYKRTAAKIGRERMSKALVDIHYGNMEIGSELTSFWLGGPLAISADEQTHTMEALARRTLPFAAKHMEIVDAMLLQAPGTFRRGKPIEVGITWDPATTSLHAKSGSWDAENDSSFRVRWFVGHLQASGHRYAFASLVVANQELSTEALSLAAHELADAGLVHRK